MAAQDPRDIVTPDAFSVAPELLGRPLASPVRRLGAMLVDLVAVACLASLPALILGVAGAAACGRAAFRTGDGRSRLRQVLLVGLGAFVLALGIASAFVSDSRPLVQVGAGDERMAMSAGGALGFVVQTLALRSADTDADRRAAARALVASVHQAQPDRDAARALLEEILAEMDVPQARAALEAEMSLAMPAPSEPPPDPAIADLRQDLRAAQARVGELEDQVRELSQPRGLLGVLGGLADDLGLGFGWSIVYFTVLSGTWKGRTLGKRLFGCRVARLDGKPLTWWHAFNRAGGYAASLATGLLGFAELLWDPNRQALHDRISGTVVLKDPS